LAIPVGATCSVAVAARVHPRRWSMVMVLVMRWLVRRNSSSSSNSIYHNHHNHSNRNDLDNHVEVQAMVLVPKTVSPNADNARWRGIERGRMTFITLVGRAKRLCYLLSNDHRCALFFFFSSISLSLSVIASLSLSADRIVYHHVPTTSIPTPTPPSLTPACSRGCGGTTLLRRVYFH